MKTPLHINPFNFLVLMLISTHILQVTSQNIREINAQRQLVANGSLSQDPMCQAMGPKLCQINGAAVNTATGQSISGGKGAGFGSMGFSSSAKGIKMDWRVLVAGIVTVVVVWLGGSGIYGVLV
ncbi:hypothetical protein BZA77DRAFT_304338 [Pyronema omphalodes]|nr:hypothetical protein BZA77DRAFT_304338 [Pyronema omphalodes]